MSKFLPKIQHK